MGACSSKPKPSEPEVHADLSLHNQPVIDALHSKKKSPGSHGNDGKSSSLQAQLVKNGNCDVPHTLLQTLELPLSAPTSEEPGRNYCANRECCERISLKEAVSVEKRMAETEEEEEQEEEEKGVLKEKIIAARMIKNEAATCPERETESCAAEKDISIMESCVAREAADGRKSQNVVAQKSLRAEGLHMCEDRGEGGGAIEWNKVVASSILEFRRNSERHIMNSHASKDATYSISVVHEGSVDSWLKHGDGERTDEFMGVPLAQQDMEEARQPTSKEEDKDRPSLRTLACTKPAEFISKKDTLAIEIDAVFEKLASEFERQESLSSFRSSKSSSG